MILQLGSPALVGTMKSPYLYLQVAVARSYSVKRNPVGDLSARVHRVSDFLWRLEVENFRGLFEY